MKTAFTLWLAMTALVAAGLEFPETLKELHAPADANKVTAEFKFTNAGNNPVTIRKYDSGCSCLVARLKDGKLRYAPGESGVLFADFTLGNFSGSVDKMIVVWLDDDPHDAPSLKLTVRVHVPLLVAVEPKTLNWKLGGQASPQTIRVTMKDARPTHVTSVTCTNQSFKTAIKPIDDGKVYEISVTPEDTGKPAMGILRIETDNKNEKQRIQQAFLLVRKPTPGETVAKP